jgi:hypothetical protein
LPVECVARSRARGIPEEVCSTEKAAMEAWAGPAIAALREAVAARPHALLIDAMAVFCPQRTCRPGDQNGLDFSDTHHVSAAGARKIMAASDQLGLARGQAEAAAAE